MRLAPGNTKARDVCIEAGPEFPWRFVTPLPISANRLNSLIHGEEDYVKRRPSNVSWFPCSTDGGEKASHAAMGIPSDSGLSEYILRYDAEWPPAPMPLAPDLEAASDESLFQLLKRRSRARRREALHALYNRYYLDVWRFIRSHGGLAEDDAKDIFAEVWKIACEDLHKTDNWQDAPIKVWLIKVADIRVKAFFRESGNEDDISLDDLYEQAVSLIEKELQLDSESPPAKSSPRVKTAADRLLKSALSILDDTERQIILRTYYKGRNSTQIGEALDLKSGTVRKKHQRALEKLRGFFRKNEISLEMLLGGRQKNLGEPDSPEGGH